MYHSVKFGDKNTWDDWYLIPNSRPIFTPPEQKTNYLDIPGGNGSLDMSEILTHYPVYNNRTGSFTFKIMNDGAASYPECNPRKLDDTYSRIMAHLHGKRMQAVLEDDDQYFYIGRFHVEGITPGPDWSTIEIGYNVDPYKYEVLSTMDDWLWDPFNFETGVITKGMYTNIAVTTTRRSITYDSAMIGDKPISPKFIVTASNNQGVYVKCVNPVLGIDKTKLIPVGTSVDYDIVMYGETTLTFYTSSGTGVISMDFHRGKL